MRTTIFLLLVSTLLVGGCMAPSGFVSKGCWEGHGCNEYEKLNMTETQWKRQANLFRATRADDARKQAAHTIAWGAALQIPVWVDEDNNQLAVPILHLPPWVAGGYVSEEKRVIIEDDRALSACLDDRSVEFCMKHEHDTAAATK